MTRGWVAIAVVIGGYWSATGVAQVAPYNPYADMHEAAPPVAADGTIHWGTFYKSAKLQGAYERLWNLGACRGSNKAITVPVAENKLVIDRLPEADFSGVVRGAVGSVAGGLVAFDEGGGGRTSDEPLVAQLHPAGVTRFQVVGRTTASVLAVGMVIRFRGEVDDKGHGVKPVSAVEIVTPPPGFVPDPVRVGHDETIVGTIVSVRKHVVGVRVNAGRLRKLVVEIPADAVVSIDAARLDLVAAGDAIEVKGRLWTGEGAMGSGTVFVSDVIVSKRPVAEPAADTAPMRTIGAR